MNKLHIELELVFSRNAGEEELNEQIKDAILSNESKFSVRMARVCGKYDMRAELLDETLQVNDVDLSDSGGVVCVAYDYDAYYGCKDMNHCDAVEDEWEFRLDENKIIFDLELPERERNDEY